MENIKIPRSLKAYLPLIGLFLLLVFIMPRSPKFNYEYRKGSPWMHETLLAQFDFPVLKTDVQLQEERDKAGSEIIPYYRLDGKVASRSKNELAALDLGEHSSLRPFLEEILTSIYSKGVLAPSAGQNVEDLKHNPGNLIYVQKDRRAFKVPVSEVFTQEDAVAYLYDSLAEVYAGNDLDSLYDATSVASLVVPDLVFDQQTTDLVHEERVNYVSSCLLYTSPSPRDRG